MLNQETLGLTLRQADRKSITGRYSAEPDVPNLTTSIVENDAIQLMTSLEHRVDYSCHLKQLERTRKDCQRSGRSGRSRHLIDDSELHAIPSELACHGQSDRAGTDDENIERKVRSHTLFG